MRTCHLIVVARTCAGARGRSASLSVPGVWSAGPSEVDRGADGRIAAVRVFLAGSRRASWVPPEACLEPGSAGGPFPFGDALEEAERLAADPVEAWLLGAGDSWPRL